MLLDSQTMSLDTKYGVFEKRKNVPIILISNSLPYQYDIESFQSITSKLTKSSVPTAGTGGINLFKSSIGEASLKQRQCTGDNEMLKLPLCTFYVNRILLLHHPSTSLFFDKLLTHLILLTAFVVILKTSYLPVSELPNVTQNLSPNPSLSICNKSM